MNSANDQSIRKISAGENHNAYITEESRVFTSGSNIFGQLGNGDEETKGDVVYYPLKGIERTKLIVQISCGSDHSFALSNTGDVYSWGLNFKGQLGLGDVENWNEATLV